MLDIYILITFITISLFAVLFNRGINRKYYLNPIKVNLEKYIMTSESSTLTFGSFFSFCLMSMSFFLLKGFYVQYILMIAFFVLIVAFEFKRSGANNFLYKVVQDNRRGTTIEHLWENTTLMFNKLKVKTNNRFATIENNQAKVNDKFTIVDDKLTITSNRFTTIENNQAKTNNRLTTIDNKLAITSNRFTAIEGNQIKANNRFTTIDNKLAITNNRFKTIEANQVKVNKRFTDIENDITKTSENFKVYQETFISDLERRVKKFKNDVNFLFNKKYKKDHIINYVSEKFPNLIDEKNKSIQEIKNIISNGGQNVFKDLLEEINENNKLEITQEQYDNLLFLKNETNTKISWESNFTELLRVCYVVHPFLANQSSVTLIKYLDKYFDYTLKNPNSIYKARTEAEKVFSSASISYLRNYVRG